MAESFPGSPEFGGDAKGDNSKKESSNTPNRNRRFGRFVVPDGAIGGPRRIESGIGNTPLHFGAALRGQLLGELGPGTAEPKPADVISEHAGTREAKRYDRAETPDEDIAPEKNEKNISEQVSRHEDSEAPEQSEEDAMLAEIAQDAPERKAAATAAELHDQALPRGQEVEIGPEAERTSAHTIASEAAFQAIAGSPELADLASRNLPETPGLSLDEQVEPEAFQKWVQDQHPELTSLTSSNAANSPRNNSTRNGAPVPSGNGPGGGGFGPNSANPNQPSSGSAGNASGGGANRPPGPPSPNAGGWNNNPNGQPSGPNQPLAANLPNNPWAPVGNALSPAALAGVSVVEARRQLDSLRHTAREIGLAGAVGVLGLALVADHLWARRRFGKDRKGIKNLNNNLRRTNESLQQERARHHTTEAKLRRVEGERRATAERLRRVEAHDVHERQPFSREAIIGRSLMSVAAVAELAREKGQRAETPLASSSSARMPELAGQLEHNQELGRAIKRNPELSELRNPAEVHEVANATKPEVRQLTEVATASQITELQRELRHERLQSQGLDAAIQARATSRGTKSQIAPGLSDGSSWASSTPATASRPATQGAALSDRRQRSGSNHAPAVAAGVVLLLLIAAAVVLFVV